MKIPLISTIYLLNFTPPGTQQQCCDFDARHVFHIVTDFKF